MLNILVTLSKYSQLPYKMENIIPVLRLGKLSSENLRKSPKDTEMMSTSRFAWRCMGMTQRTWRTKSSYSHSRKPVLCYHWGPISVFSPVGGGRVVCDRGDCSHLYLPYRHRWTWVCLIGLEDELQKWLCSRGRPYKAAEQIEIACETSSPA